MQPRRFAELAMCVMIVCAGVRIAAGDYLVLKNRGELRGELVPTSGAAQADLVTIRTLTGATVAVAKSEVQSTMRRRLVLEEHAARSRIAPPTAEAQWELAEWCRERGLKDEREAHLQRVLEFDADHVLAHRGLGHTQSDGEWITREELMISRGYVRHKGKFVLPQELELMKQEERETESEKAWYKKIKMWKGWLLGARGDRVTDALANLQSISDPTSIRALYKSFSNDPNEQHRLLYISILAQMRDEKALSPRVYQSLNDVSQHVRGAALRSVSDADRQKVVPMYVQALRDNVNVIVNRAGAALGEIGDRQTVPKLIDALVTHHKYKVEIPTRGNFTAGFGTNGQMVGPNTIALPPEVGVPLLTGQYPYGVQVDVVAPPTLVQTKTIIVEQDESNPSVRAALKKLTGQDFAFDEDKWRAWFAANKDKIGVAAPATP